MVTEKIKSLKDDIDSVEAKIEEIPRRGSDMSATDGVFNDDGLVLTGYLLVFSIFVFSLMGFLILKGKESETILRTFGSVLIIVASVFLIVAGYSEQQISPVIGLLGTVAGYILGKTEK